MKRFLQFSILLCVFLSQVVEMSFAQSSSSEIIPVSPSASTVADPSRPLNFEKVTAKNRTISEAWRKLNEGFEAHPDAAFVSLYTPDNAIEVLAKRTETTRYYVDAHNPSLVYSQGALGALHYRKDNQWLAMDPRLDQKEATVFEASHQPLPVGFETARQFSYIQFATGKLQFNQWELYGVTATKEKKKIAQASWENISVGDDGVRIANLFPGVDAEMQVLTGSVKTTFYLKRWEFGDFQEVILMDTYRKGVQPLTFFYDKIPVRKGRVAGEIVAKEGKNTVLEIGKAFMYVEQDPSSAVDLSYEIAFEALGIVLQRSSVEELLRQGVVIIDPLVQGREGRYAPATALNSFRTRDNAACDNYAFEASCSYSWTVPLPGGIEVISTSHINNMQVIAPCTRDKMGFRIVLGDGMTCGPGILWYPESRPPTPGGVGGSPNVINNYNDCIPVQCTDSDLKVSLSILRACMGPVGCEASCVSGNGPFVMTVLGRTLESAPITASVDVSQEVCPEQVVQLRGSALYGKKPYTYRWSDGSTGANLQVKPTVNTSYQIEVTDACQNKVFSSIEVKVKKQLPQPTIQLQVDPMDICPGQTVNMLASVQGEVEQVTYQWQVNGVDRNGAISLDWRSETLQNQDEISFKVRVSQECFDDYFVTSEAKVVSVYDEPIREEVQTVIGCHQVEYEGQTYFDSVDLIEMVGNRNGCDSLRKIIRIQVEHFQVTLSALTPLDIFEGQPVHLKATSSSPDFHVVRWEPSSLFLDQAAKEQRMTGSESQTFIVHALSKSGCESADTLSLRVQSGSNVLLMPTAFSPNGDLVNDRWEPTRLNDFPEAELFVYNRWGICVYHTADYTQTWDGTYKGKLVPSGVYTYRLLVPGRKEIVGSVSVLY